MENWVVGLDLYLGLFFLLMHGVYMGIGANISTKIRSCLCVYK